MRRTRSDERRGARHPREGEARAGATPTTRRERRRALCAPLFAIAAAQSALGCDQSYAGGAWVELEIEAASVTPGPDGTGTLDVELLVRLSAYETADTLALDAVTFSIVEEAGGLHQERAADRVEVDERDWPVELDPFEQAERRGRASVAAPLPPIPSGPCPTEVAAGLSVDLLTVGGRMQASSPLVLEIPGGPARLGIVRSGGDVASGELDPWASNLATTVDEAGEVWTLVGDFEQTRLWSRTPEGAVEHAPISSAAVTMAALDRGVVLVESRQGLARVSRVDRPGGTTWILEVEPISAPGPFGGGVLPVAATTDRIAVAMPPGSQVAERPDLGSVEPWLLELDADGEPLGVTRIAPGAAALAFAGETLVVRTFDEVLGLRGGEERWRVPLAPSDQYAGVWPVLAALGADDFVIATGAGLSRRSARDGAERWTTPWGTVPASTSLAVVRDEEILASSGGWGARWSAEGELFFEGAISCGGRVAFGGAGGRVAWASIGAGLEGWGDAPDREVPIGTLSMGEVAP